MHKVISFSVFGKELKYIIGAIKNAQLAPIFFPGWKTVFYVSDQIEKKFLEELKKVGDKVNILEEPWDASGMFWRFREVANLTNKRVIIRDTDSRLSLRDAYSVNEWIKSQKSLHIIRDHPSHNAPILGGLWGILPESLPKFSEELFKYTPRGSYGEDQQFLYENVYKVLKSDKFVQDEFFCREIRKTVIGIERLESEFLGESLDEHDNFNVYTRNIVQVTKGSLRRKLKLKILSFIMKLLGR